MSPNGRPRGEDGAHGREGSRAEDHGLRPKAGMGFMERPWTQRLHHPPSRASPSAPLRLPMPEEAVTHPICDTSLGPRGGPGSLL